MSKPRVAGWVVMGLSILDVASQAKLVAQTLECPAESSGALMQASYPAFPDATELALMLTGYGFKVKCIARSVFEGFVPGTKGAALYITDQGSISTWYCLPEPPNF